MAGFSYESDIAPLRRTNFGGRDYSALSPSGAEYQRALDLDTAVKVEEIKESSQRQQLAFEEARLSLQKTRKQIQDQLEFDKALPELELKIKSFVDDPNLDSTSKIMGIEKTRLEYGKFASSPQFNSMFDNINRAIAMKDTNEAFRRQAAYDAARLGDKAGAQAIVGSESEAGKSLGILADTVQRGLTREQESEKEKSRFKSQEEQEKDKTNILKSQLEYIQGLSPEKDQLSGKDGEWGAGGTSMTDEERRRKQFLKPIDKIALLKMYRSLNPLATGVEDKDIPDYDLVEGVYSKLYDQYTTRTGVLPESKISEKSK